MRKTFLEFLDKRQQFNINEGFSEKNIDKALDLIIKVLTDKIDGLIPLEGIVLNKIGDKEVYSKQFMVLHGKKYGQTSLFQINWIKSSSTTEVYSIDFFKDLELLFNGKSKSSLTIYTLGKSIVYFLPIIWTVANNQKYDLSEKEAIDLGRSVFKGQGVKESLYYVGALSYRILENMSDEIIDEAYLLNIQESDDEVKDYKNKKRAERDEAYLHRKESPEAKQRFNNLKDEYDEIVKAIKGGASTMEELQVALKRNLSVSYVPGEDEQKAEKEFEQEREDPDVVFKKMSAYVNMVIDGTNPSVILCGAPGVGKTYRIKQQLKAHDYHEGHGMFTIKGKCTPRVLYCTLYEYQDKGQIVVIDDADGLVGPKAPEDCINILKGALDSTSDDEGRLVSYGVSGKIMNDDGEELPKRFYYRGGIIVITNYNAGQLDTALRGRSFVQDIHFTTEDILKIIKKLMPALDPEHLSSKSKIKAYDYLLEMLESNAKMEVSIRTFTICAKIFESCGKMPDFSDEDCKSMIKEQMKLQAQRGGKKY